MENPTRGLEMVQGPCYDGYVAQNGKKRLLGAPGDRKFAVRWGKLHTRQRMLHTKGDLYALYNDSGGQESQP